MGWNGGQAEQFCPHCGMPVSRSIPQYGDGGTRYFLKNLRHRCQRCGLLGCSFCMEDDEGRGFHHNNCQNNGIVSTEVWLIICRALRTLCKKPNVNMVVEVWAGKPDGVVIFQTNSDENGDLKVQGERTTFRIGNYNPLQLPELFSELKSIYCRFTAEP